MDVMLGLFCRGRFVDLGSMRMRIRRKQEQSQSLMWALHGAGRGAERVWDG
jgi:hypothetical protein